MKPLLKDFVGAIGRSCSTWPRRSSSVPRAERQTKRASRRRHSGASTGVSRPGDCPVNLTAVLDWDVVSVVRGAFFQFTKLERKGRFVLLCSRHWTGVTDSHTATGEVARQSAWPSLLAPEPMACHPGAPKTSGTRADESRGALQPPVAFLGINAVQMAPSPHAGTLHGVGLGSLVEPVLFPRVSHASKKCASLTVLGQSCIASYRGHWRESRGLPHVARSHCRWVRCRLRYSLVERGSDPRAHRASQCESARSAHR